MALPVNPPLEPMLAALTGALPAAGDWCFEPKWDGFRALVFKDGDAVHLQSRDLRPLERYFPEVVDALRRALPDRVVLDGEIVLRGPRGLDFELLQLRLHPAASRVAKLARETPASFVAFDCLALGDEDLRAQPLALRRARLEEALAAARAPVHLTPMTRDRALAADWFERFEGAGFDGVIAKEPHAPYLPGKRGWLKVKHARTADCVVAGFRWHKGGEGTRVGSLILGLWDGPPDAGGRLHHVGVVGAFTMAVRARLVAELAPLRDGALAAHPWREWAGLEAPTEVGLDAAEPGQRMPGGQSRWSQGKDLSWQPLRLERVCEVKYDHLQGSRFRHAAHLLRWRPDKRSADCTYAQLEVVAPAELDQIFAPAPRGDTAP